MEMYLKCAECETDEGFKANFYKDAANAIKSVDTDRYIQLTKDAIKLFSIAGRAGQACTLAKDAAEKLEEEYNYDLAREFYEEAAGLYEADNATSYMNQCFGKWADLTILIGDKKEIAKVIKTYDKIGKKYLQKSLVRSSATDYFFKASLCFLYNDDMPGAKNQIENYGYEDPGFDTSR